MKFFSSYTIESGEGVIDTFIGWAIDAARLACYAAGAYALLKLGEALHFWHASSTFLLNLQLKALGL